MSIELFFMIVIGGGALGGALVWFIWWLIFEKSWR